ncbi:apolipoprotein N-acyltransferase [Caldimonas sp. KR1-144]|uniref:apolipoprotein N-acyltransferase n=1 Tax=Caldimonas sp. KR1-144 TaxID=3400911 RepID=UPI003C0A6045
MSRADIRALPAWADALGLLLAGALHAFAFAPREAWWLQIACVVLLAWRFAAAPSARRAALAGFAFSLGWLTLGVWWLFISMHRYGGLPAPLAALAVLALTALLSIYLAAAGAAFVRWRSGRPLADAALFAALWLAAELARGELFTGFPWLAAGYAHADSPLAALAPWLGVYGIGAASAFAAALIVGGVRLRRAPPFALALAAIALPPLLPAAFTHPTGEIGVALLQGNVPQNEKFEVRFQPEALAWTARAMLDAPADLVVAPETAIPFLPEQLPEGFWDGLRNAFAGSERAALIGVPLVRPLADGGVGYTNSAAGFSAAAQRLPEGFYRYDKHHLVPFGEFIPLGFHWFVAMMNIPLGDFERGPLDAPSFEVNGQRIGPNVCYEDLFGEELAARFVEPRRAPTVLANLSNIAWFGETEAVDQHLQISRLRSLELQRPMLRATNTGATAVIDHRGKVARWLEPHTRGVLLAKVQGREGTTPFAWWAGRLGLWPLWLVALSVTALMARRAPR